MKPRIVFTGGGTAGHVTPNLAVIEAVKAEGWSVDYIGSKASVEEEIIQATGIDFHAVSSGKLRRYFSWKTFIDPFKITWGIFQSYRLLRSLKADIVFSKGGFVAFPVVVGAWLNKIPVVAHESDLTPGLANRLCYPFVDKICVTFAPAKKHFKHPEKVEITGTPLRSELFQGKKSRGLDLCGFQADKPCLMVMGGSQGAQRLNQTIRELLPELSETWQIIHLCGRGKVDASYANVQGYCQFEYASETLPDLFAAADLLVSRSGANSLYEILALQKPHVLIPLSAKISRGDQIQNANYFQKQGISTVVDDDTLNKEKLLQAIESVHRDYAAVQLKIRQLDIQPAVNKIISVLKECLDFNKHSCMCSVESKQND